MRNSLPGDVNDTNLFFLTYLKVNRITLNKIFPYPAEVYASWQDLPYANLPRLIERASFL